MTPADKRIAELIDHWLTSIDLHLKYVDLSQEEYERVQAWPKHDRPTRWVLELARQKVLELKAQCESRVAMGDSKFAESLELMAFLANLVGSQHIQRFIPLANPNAEPVKPAKAADPESTREMPRVGETTTREMPRLNGESTREMPKILTAPEPTREMPKLKTPATPARPKSAPEPKMEHPPAKAEVKKPVRAAPVAAAPVSSAELEEKIVADAIRLLRWGRQWHELAELIARIADRPNVTEIRRVLRAHRGSIEAQVGAEA